MNTLFSNPDMEKKTFTNNQKSDGMKVITKNGYDFFEVTSALQKAIRRGEDENAIYWATELFLSGYEGYLWRRMKIYVSEDIGLAEPMMPAVINALHQNFEAQKKDNTNEKKKRRPEKMFLIHAIMLLSRAKKSRLMDYLTPIAFKGHADKKLPIPDYAYDQHNFKGKQMGRGLDHFYDEGGKLNNQAKIDGEEKYKEIARALNKKYPGPVNLEEVKKGTLTQQEMTFGDVE